MGGTSILRLLITCPPRPGGQADGTPRRASVQMDRQVQGPRASGPPPRHRRPFSAEPCSLLPLFRPFGNMIQETPQPTPSVGGFRSELCLRAPPTH